jgi:O-antigen ligase
MQNFFLSTLADKTLLFLVFFFPLIVVLGNAATNIITTFVSVIVIFLIYKKGPKNFFKNRLVKYIIFFFSFILINSIIHFTSLDLLLKSLGNFRYLFLSAAVFIVFEKMSEKKKIFFIYFNIIIISLIALDILYQFFFYKDIFGFAPGMCTEILPIKCLRFSGVFGDWLVAGTYLSQIGFLILLLFLNLELKKDYINFLVKSFLCLFLLTIILLTGERNALLIIIIAIFFIFLFKKKIINFFLFLIFLTIIIFFSAQKIESIDSRFVKLFDSWSSNSKEKSIINKAMQSPWSYHYQAAIELFLQKPILGHGSKSFRLKCVDTNIDKKTKEQAETYHNHRACSTHPHNYFLEFLSEQGIVGGIFYLGLIFIIFINVIRECKNIKNKNILIVIGTGSLILAIIFPFKPSGSFFSTFNATMLFYIFGFFLYYLKKIK